jgi:hypothetical protein
LKISPSEDSSQNSDSANAVGNIPRLIQKNKLTDMWGIKVKLPEGQMEEERSE